MNKALVFLLTALTLLTSLFLSCSQDNKALPSFENSNADVSILLDIKDLNIISPTELVKYEYNATPNFSVEKPEMMVGDCKTKWVVISPDGKGFVNLGYFTPGNWTVKLRGYNTDNNQVYIGEKTLYLRAGLKNYIEINMVPIDTSDKQSIINFDFTVTEIETLSNINNVILTLFPLNGKTVGTGFTLPCSWSVTKGTNGQTRFQSRLLTDYKGPYLMLVEIFNRDNTYITGQLVSMTLVGGSSVIVTGNLEEGAYLEGVFAITEDKSEIIGNLQVSMGTKWVKKNYNDSIIPVYWASKEANNNATVTFSLPSMALYVWTIDGQKIENTSSSFVINPNTLSIGPHTISLTTSVREKTATNSFLVYVLEQSQWSNVINGSFSNGGVS